METGRFNSHFHGIYHTPSVLPVFKLLGSEPIYVPSASVVPETSTTWIKASACLKSSKNLLPSPFPSWAPGTSPATSRSSIGTRRTSFSQEP